MVTLLHGKGGSGAAFEAAAAPLLAELPGAVAVAPDAPHAAGGGYAWWTCEGRSYEADVWEGFDEALARAEAACAGASVVVGHSQVRARACRPARAHTGTHAPARTHTGTQTHGHVRERMRAHARARQFTHTRTRAQCHARTASHARARAR